MNFDLPKKTVERIKEVLRWAVLFLVSWVITSTLGQADLIPEIYALNVWVFVYEIPVRSSFVGLLTILGRLADRLLHTKDLPTPLTFKSLDAMKK